MRIAQEEFEHPTQASRVRLNLYELQAPPPGQPTPASAELRKGGYLLTEEREGTVTVVATLGFFESREAGLVRLRRRAGELQQQRYRPVAPAA